MYKYENEKHKIFTEEGQVGFLQVRDKAKIFLRKAGAFTMGAVISELCGDSWEMMAYVDRLVELKEIREITGGGTPGQNRVFVKGR